MCCEYFLPVYSSHISLDFLRWKTKILIVFNLHILFNDLFFLYPLQQISAFSKLMDTSPRGSSDRFYYYTPLTDSIWIEFYGQHEVVLKFYICTWIMNVWLAHGSHTIHGEIFLFPLHCSDALIHTYLTVHTWIQIQTFHSGLWTHMTSYQCHTDSSFSALFRILLLFQISFKLSYLFLCESLHILGNRTSFTMRNTIETLGWLVGDKYIGWQMTQQEGGTRADTSTDWLVSSHINNLKS